MTMELLVVDVEKNDIVYVRVFTSQECTNYPSPAAQPPPSPLPHSPLSPPKQNPPSAPSAPKQNPLSAPSPPHSPPSLPKQNPPSAPSPPHSPPQYPTSNQFDEPSFNVRKSLGPRKKSIAQKKKTSFTNRLEQTTLNAVVTEEQCDDESDDDDYVMSDDSVGESIDNVSLVDEGSDSGEHSEDEEEDNSGMGHSTNPKSGVKLL